MCKHLDNGCFLRHPGSEKGSIKNLNGSIEL